MALDEAIAGAAGAVGGSVISGLFSKSASKKAYKRQRKLRQTAYHDTMWDLKRSGLNPILAYRAGASGTGSVQMAHMPDMGQALSQGAQAGVATARETREGETATPLRKSQEQVFIQDLENKRATGKLLELDFLKGLGAAANSVTVFEYLKTPEGRNAAIANFAPMTEAKLGGLAYAEAMRSWKKIRDSDTYKAKGQSGSSKAKARPFGGKPKEWDPFAPAQLPTFQGPGWGRGY